MTTVGQPNSEVSIEAEVRQAPWTIPQFHLAWTERPNLAGYRLGCSDRSQMDQRAFGNNAFEGLSSKLDSIGLVIDRS